MCEVYCWLGASGNQSYGRWRTREMECEGEEDLQIVVRLQ